VANRKVRLSSKMKKQTGREINKLDWAKIRKSDWFGTKKIRLCGKYESQTERII
jgi:hypothetical protein